MYFRKASQSTSPPPCQNVKRRLPPGSSPTYHGLIPQKAIDIVKRAIEEDEKQDYQEAYRLYQQSLEYFMTALKCFHSPFTALTCVSVDEKNEKSKQMIKKKVGEYLERAEKLKDHLSKPTTKDGKPAAASANGVGTGGKAK